MTTTFPKRRPDNSLAVAAVFEVVQESGRDVVADEVATYLNRNAFNDGLVQLGSGPTVRDLADGGVEIVLDVPGTARHWRQCLVEIVTPLRSVSSLRFVGFFDLVGGRYHRAASSQTDSSPRPVAVLGLEPAKDDSTCLPPIQPASHRHMKPTCSGPEN